MTTTKKAILAITMVFIAAIVVFAVRKQKASTVTFFAVPVEKGPLRNTVNATGVVQTVVTVQVGSQVSGQVQDLYADYNSLVKRGQLLAKLDPRSFQAQLQQTEADLNRARLNLEYCNIYSPVDGVVISRNIDVGQTIAASLQSPTLFTIANDLSQMQVNANVDEADIGNISDQAEVRFTVDAYPNDF